MKVVYLGRALRDMAWVRQYYRIVFPAGRSNAREQLRKAESLIAKNPFMGHSSEEIAGARELYIPRTPFSLIYQVTNERIEVLRVIDNRSNWGSSEE